MTALLVVLAGALGSVARLVVDGEIRTRWPSGFPWATVAVNVTGTALLGAVLALGDAHGVGAGWRLVVGVGFCGGYTTFGTASLEVVRLAQQGRPGAALGYALGPLVVAVGAGAATYSLVAAL